VDRESSSVLTRGGGALEDIADEVFREHPRSSLPSGFSSRNGARRAGADGERARVEVQEPDRHSLIFSSSCSMLKGFWMNPRHPR
jgi:hypothetical protein